ncbi:hypothetical protein ACFL40_02890 [candidate division KSB1 bacterium]
MASAVRPKILSDVLRNLVEHQPDMKLVCEVLDPIELFFAVKTTLIDVVIITSVDSKRKPRICRLLLAEYPKLKAVTLSAKCDVAFLYKSNTSKKRVDHPSGQSFLDAIRKSMS